MQNSRFVILVGRFLAILLSLLWTSQAAERDANLNNRDTLETKDTSMNVFKIYLTSKSHSPGEGNFGALAQQLPLEEILFSEDDVETLNWKNQTFTLTQSATSRLISNWKDFLSNPEANNPEGKYIEAETQIFIMTLGDAKLLCGVIAGVMTLYQPPNRPLLYPSQPMIQNGHLVLGLGHPKTKELGEDFFKIFVEKGADVCFTPVLEEKIKNHFIQLGKLSEK